MNENVDKLIDEFTRKVLLLNKSVMIEISKCNKMSNHFKK